MKRLVTWAIVLAASGLVGSCSSGLPFPAPDGATIEVNPADLEILGPGGVYLFEAVVRDVDGIPLNQIQVTIKTMAGSDDIMGPNYVLVPETAIAGQSQSDTTWQVDAAEQYYELTMVDDQIQPDFVLTQTDSHGVARVYFYPRCIPTDCIVVGYSWPMNSCVVTEEEYYDVYLDLISSGLTTCEGQDALILFSIGVASVEVTISSIFTFEFVE